MYNFLLNLWINHRVTEEKLSDYVSKGFITQDENNQIIATPQS